MEAFFPTLMDEYGAWRASAPGMFLTPAEREVLRSRAPPRDRLVDANSYNFLLDLATNQTDQARCTADLAQMETMSEIAHPWRGLPNLVNTAAVGAVKLALADGEQDGIPQLVMDSAFEGAQPMWRLKFESAVYNTLRAAFTLLGRSSGQHMITDRAEVKSEMQLAATTVAKGAIRSVDLVASLDGIAATIPAYAYERLFGLFAFVVSVDMEPSACAVYALYMLPRVFGGALEASEETEIFLEYIPAQLMQESTSLRAGRIADALTNTSVAARAWLPHRNGKASMSGWWRMVNGIRMLTVDANTTTAQASGEWLSGALLHANTHHWFLDGCLYQLMQRKESVVQHRSLEHYMMSKRCQHECRVSLLNELLTHGKLTIFSSEDAHVVTSRWALQDFDLIVEILNIPTLYRPVLTPQDFAHRLTVQYQTNIAYGSSHVFTANEMALFRRRVLAVLESNLGVAASRQRNDNITAGTAIALGDLLDECDTIFSRGSWTDFVDLQHDLGLLRVKARHPVNASNVPLLSAVLAEYPKLFSTSRNGVDAVVHTLFIPSHLMVAPNLQSLQPKQIHTVLSGSMSAAAKTVRKHRLPCSDLAAWCTKLWPTQPDWWEMFKILLPFTWAIDANPLHTTAAFEWIANAVDQQTTTNWMLDAALLHALRTNSSRVPFQALLTYAANRVREQKYTARSFVTNVTKFSQCTSQWKANSAPADALIAVAYHDFALFVELGDVRLYNREAMKVDSLATKLEAVFDAIPDGKASSREVAGVLNDALLGYALARLNAAARVVPGAQLSTATRSRISGLVRKVERVLASATSEATVSGRTNTDWEKRTVMQFSAIVTQLNVLRLVSDFSEDPSEATANLAAVMTEFLDATQWTSLRMHLLKSFIPRQLVPLASTMGTRWIAAVVRASVEHPDVRNLEHPCGAPLVSHARSEQSQHLILWLSNDRQRTFGGDLEREYTLGDVRAFAHAVQLETKNNNPSWLLDALAQTAFRLTHGVSNKGEIGLVLKQPWIRPYFGFRAECVDILLGFAGKSAHETSFIRKYAGGDMDTMFDLSAIATEDRRNISAEVLSALVSKGLASGISGTAEIDFVAELVNNFILTRLPPVSSRNDATAQATRALVAALDTYLHRSKPKTSAPIVSSTTHLRLAVEFFGTPEQMIAQAMTEVLSERCHDARRSAYEWFIPGVLLGQHLKNARSTWVRSVAVAAAESDWSTASAHTQLTTSQRDFVRKILLREVLVSNVAHSKQLAMELQDAVLPNRTIPSELVDLIVLDAVQATTINAIFTHATLKKYVSMPRSYGLDFRLALLMVVTPNQAYNPLIVQHSVTDFDVYAALGSLVTVGRKQPSVEAVVNAVSTGAGAAMNITHTDFYTWVLEKYILTDTKPHDSRQSCPFAGGLSECTAITTSGLLAKWGALLDAQPNAFTLARAVQRLQLLATFIRGRANNLDFAMSELTAIVHQKNGARIARWMQLVGDILVADAIDGIMEDSPTATSAWVPVWLARLDAMLSTSVPNTVISWAGDVLQQAHTKGAPHQISLILQHLEHFLAAKVQTESLRGSGGSVLVWEDLYYSLLRGGHIEFKTEAARYSGNRLTTPFQFDLMQRLLTENVAKVLPPRELCPSAKAKCDSLRTLVHLVESKTNRRTFAVVSTLLQARMKGWDLLPTRVLLAELNTSLAALKREDTQQRLPVVLDLLDHTLHGISTAVSVGGVVSLHCLPDADHALLSTLITTLEHLTNTTMDSKVQTSKQLENLRLWRPCNTEWWNSPFNTICSLLYRVFRRVVSIIW